MCHIIYIPTEGYTPASHQIQIQLHVQVQIQKNTNTNKLQIHNHVSHQLHSNRGAHTTVSPGSCEPQFWIQIFSCLTFSFLSFALAEGSKTCQWSQHGGKVSFIRTTLVDRY